MAIVRPVGLEPKSVTGTRAPLETKKRLPSARRRRKVSEQNMVAAEMETDGAFKKLGANVDLLYLSSPAFNLPI